MTNSYMTSPNLSAAPIAADISVISGQFLNPFIRLSAISLTN